ncbi:MAG: hypothetical protein JJE17_00035 [Peptostreptococcaceae bacterium]|nr:hypothetical protein [Peptostreptococcaceae bacterium]
MGGNNKESSIIEIFCTSMEFQDLAEATGYGIEEEGIPYRINFEAIKQGEVYDICHRNGIGVTIHIDEGVVAVFYRQLKEHKPLFDYHVKELEIAKTIGKNAARIIKKKPFIEII